MFSKEFKENLKKEGKELKLCDASKLCGEKWKNMTLEQKQPYENLFKLNRDKYSRDKERIRNDKNFGISPNFNLNNNNNEPNNFNDIDNNFSNVGRNDQRENMKKKEYNNIIEDENNNFN